MLLFQIAFTVVICIPFGIWSVYTLITETVSKNLERNVVERLVNTILYLLVNFIFADRYSFI